MERENLAGDAAPRRLRKPPPRGSACADLRPHADFGQSASEKEAQMRKFHDLTGQRFGRLTVLERAPNDKDGIVCWHCICECGTTKEIRDSALIYGNTRSCGCLNDAEHRSHRDANHVGLL
jgi:hypothetical protein